jgi:ribosomal protein S6--L-glutamate ligase
MELNVAGVDMLQSDSGPMVLEVNSSPGLEGIESASGVDIADAIIEFIEDNADHESSGRGRG